MKSRPLASLLFGLALAVAATPAFAEKYRVDLIVFIDKNATGGETTLPAQIPPTAGSVELGNEAALKSAGITVLPETAFGLKDAWSKLKNSKRFQPVIALAWVQDNPPTERGPSLHLRWGTPFVRNTAAGSDTLFPIDGTVALLLQRYLHVDADLVFTVPRVDGSVGSYHLKEKRRMKRDELHHIDAPRFGILTEVSKPAA